MRVRGQRVRLREPLQGLPVLLVPGRHRRLLFLPEGVLQHLRAEHDDLQDPGLPGPEGGVLPRAPVQPQHHRAASCPRYRVHFTSPESSIQTFVELICCFFTSPVIICYLMFNIGKPGTVMEFANSIFQACENHGIL